MTSPSELSTFLRVMFSLENVKRSLSSPSSFFKSLITDAYFSLYSLIMYIYSITIQYTNPIVIHV